jgi:hypothetical protein
VRVQPSSWGQKENGALSFEKLDLNQCRSFACCARRRQGWPLWPWPRKPREERHQRRDVPPLEKPLCCMHTASMRRLRESEGERPPQKMIVAGQAVNISTLK